METYAQYQITIILPGYLKFQLERIVEKVQWQKKYILWDNNQFNVSNLLSRERHILKILSASS